MGTRLLFIDVRDAFGLLVKQLGGNKITNRERGKINRTLNDLATLVPITILMLIPVSILIQPFLQNVYYLPKVPNQQKIFIGCY